MANLPKLKVKGLGWEASAGIHDFEQARFFPFGQNAVIVAEGQVIRSYEDLLHIAEQPEYREREFLEVQFLDILVGG